MNDQFIEALTTVNQSKPKTLPTHQKKTIHQPIKLNASYIISKDYPLFLSLHDEASNSNKHYHDFFEINYVIKGHPTSIINDREVQLPVHSLCIMNPNAVHFFKDYKDERDLILNIVLPKESFEKHIFIPLLKNPVLNAFFVRYQIRHQGEPSFLFLKDPDKSVHILIEMLIKEYIESTSYNPLIIEPLITLLFSYIFQSYKNINKKNSAVTDKILDYIYENYNSCTLKEMAQLFGYHPKYLSALIKKHTNENFRDLITRIRLQNAIHYLIYTDLPIEKISSAIGYQDKSSFYQSFKKHYKTSPAAYRSKDTFRSYDSI